jgi:hypothetical protein
MARGCSVVAEGLEKVREGKENVLRSLRLLGMGLDAVKDVKEEGIEQGGYDGRWGWRQWCEEGYIAYGVH